MYTIEKLKNKAKKREYEIQKRIYEINRLRVYAKFVNLFSGKDYKIYENNITEIDTNTNDIPINEVLKQVLENYKELLTENESQMLDPESVHNEFKMKENDIFIALNTRNKECDDLAKLKSIHKKALKELKLKIETLEEEYNFIYNIYQEQTLENEENLEETNLYSISLELFQYMYKMFSNGFKENIFLLFNLEKISQQCKNFIIELESIVNRHIDELENYEKNDNEEFSKIIQNKKTEYKLNKIKETKEKKYFYINKKSISNEKNLNKIYLRRRGVEIIKFKKKKVKIIVDDEAIKKDEDYQLLTYQ